MAEKSKVVKVIEIHGQAENLQKTLTALRKEFEGLQVPSDLDKIFSKLENSIGSVLRKTEKGIIPREDFADTEKDLNKIKTAFDNLSGSMESIRKASDKKLLSMLPEETVTKLQQAQKAYDEYAKTVRDVIKAEEQLELAKQKRDKAQTEADSKARSVSAYKGNVTRAEGELKKHKEITEALKEQKEATDELKQAQKDLDKAKKEGKGEKAIANRQARIDKATERKDAADVVISGFSKKDLEAQAAATERVTKAQEKLAAATKIAEQAAKDLSEAEVEVTSAQNSLQNAQNKSEADAKREAEALKVLRAALVAVNPEYENMAIEGETAGAQLKFLKDKIKDLSDGELAKLKSQLGKAGDGFDAFKDEVNNTKNALSGTKQAIKEADEAFAQQEAFENKIKQFLGLSGAAQVLRSALRDALQTITELDATMTEMAVVTDLTVGDYWDQLPEYSKQASELGVSINSAYKAATLYYQQGLKGNEVTKISAETLKMAKIAGLDAADATDKMTAALRGFNMEMNEASAQKVADVYSELAAITAADVDEISSAMTKTASIAHSAGMEFETTAAFLSQIIETTRESAETAGTAMKTVIARFQELKKDPSEIGEVEGEIVDANAIETALRSVGVALRDSSGQFRELDDVFLELSSKWDSLDKNTQRYIATIAAGSRQQSRFIAMMSDYGRTQELVASANNSAGASQRQFEKTTESLEYKIERLKNAWHEFTMGIMNSDLVKFGVDMLTKFLEIVNKITEGLGKKGLGGGLTKILSVVTIFKIGTKIFDKLKQPLIAMFTEVVKQAGLAGENSMKEYKAGVNRAWRGQTTQKVADDKITSSLSGKKGTVSNLGLKMSGIDQFLSAKPYAEEAKRLKPIVKMDTGERIGALRGKGEQLAQAKSKRAKLAENEKENKKAIEEADKEIKKLEEDIDDLENAETKFANASQKKWKAISNGFSAASTTLMGVGMAFGMIGNAFEDAGLEGAAEVFNTMAQYATTAGAVLGIIPPILSLIQALFPGVGASAAAAGAKASAAWSVVGIVVAAVVAGIAVAMIAIIGIMKLVKNNSPEAKMKKLAEATDEAKKAAEGAKEAYSEVMSEIESYKDAQKALEDLTYGTKEWEEQLYKVNSQVLELLDKYPDLAKWLSRGTEGQLTIDEQGFEDLALKKQKGYTNALAATNARQLDEYRAKKDKFTAYSQGAYGLTYDYTQKTQGRESTTTNNRTTGSISDAYYKEAKSLVFGSDKPIRRDSEEFKNLLKTYTQKVKEEKSKDYQNPEELKSVELDEESFWNVVESLQASREEIEKINYEMENIARANLTVLASDTVRQSEFGQQIIDTFATAQTSALYEDQVNKEVSALEKNSDYQDSEEFKRIAKEYGVADRFTGDDAHDVQTLYAAMTGLESIEDIPEGIAKDTNKMIKAIAEIDANGKQAQKMDEYVKKLDALKQTKPIAADNIAGLFSQSGKGMSYTFAELVQQYQLNGQNSNEFLEGWGKELGYNSVEEWAEALGMTIDDFYAKVESNTNKAIKARTQAYDRMNKALGRADDNRIKNFNDNLQLSIENEETLADKIVTVVGMSGAKSADEIQGYLGEALKSVGKNADLLANYLGSMNWQDLGEWDKLEEYMSEMGIVWTEAMTTFVSNAQTASNAIRKIEFKDLANDLNNAYKLLDKIEQGGRQYSEDDYNSLIATNKDLKKSFTQIGDKFVYLGGSMKELEEAVKENTLNRIKDANKYKQDKVGMGNIINEKGAGKSFQGMTDYELMNWLTSLRSSFMGSGYNIGDLGIEGLGGYTDFSKASREQLMNWAMSLFTIGAGVETYEKEAAESQRDVNIQYYTYQNEASYNKQQGQTYSDYTAQHMRAFATQATLSGGVAEADVAAYLSYVEQYEKLLEEGKTEEAKAILTNQDFVDLGDKILNGVESIIEENPSREAYQDLIERATEAIKQANQDQIDKLSELKEAYAYANQQLISKIQQQINENRQDREKERAEKDIENLRSEQAYLNMDTSGLNSLALQEIDTEIQNAEEQYQDTLVDQALQSLEDANQQAIEQRERQIDLMQQQLDYAVENGDITREAEMIVADSLTDIAEGKLPEESELGKLLKNAETKDLNTIATAEWWSEFSKSVAKAQGFDKDGNVIENKTGNQDSTSDGSTPSGADTKKQKQNNAVAAGVAAITARDSGGRNSAAYRKARNDYILSGGGKGEFDDLVGEQLDETYWDAEEKEIITGSFPGGAGFSVEDGWGNYADDDDNDIEIKTPYGTRTDLSMKPSQYDSTIDTAINKVVGKNPTDQWLALYNNEPYAYRDGHWIKLYGGQVDSLKADMKKYLNQYKSGGLADFTGPAWLDGTKSRPEYVLNADQTERFFSLVDVLEDYDKDKKPEKSGDNYFEIAINVEKLENDYDVEQVANKIRKMIYDDAMYRNVNAINHIR